MNNNEQREMTNRSQKALSLNLIKRSETQNTGPNPKSDETVSLQCTLVFGIKSQAVLPRLFYVLLCSAIVLRLVRTVFWKLNV